MNSLQELLFNVFEFVAIWLYIFVLCYLAGVACFFVYAVLRWIRTNIQNQREAELLEEWAEHNHLIACAAKDLDHKDELQRELAEYYINQRIP